MTILRIVAAGVLAVTLGAPAAFATPVECMAASGRRGQACLAAYTKAVDQCRKKQDAACEDALRADGGALAQLLDANDEPIAGACDDADAEALDYRGADDVQLRIDDGCVDWAEDALELEYAADLGSLDGPSGCQRTVAKELAKLRARQGRSSVVPAS
jgi:hypothetical protein